MFSLLATFSPLLSLSAMNSSKCPWLFPSHIHNKTFPCHGAVVSSGDTQTTFHFLLFFFEWKDCQTVWHCTKRRILFSELCLHMASFIPSGIIPDKWFPTVLRNGLPLLPGFLFHGDWSLLCCLKLCYLRRNNKLEHLEMKFSLVYFYQNFTNCHYYAFQVTTKGKSQSGTWHIDRGGKGKF